ncbi:thioredoxin fold domain-containing protein [Acidithiobacillus sp.]|jgi:thiol:disulfide interchange protein DsbG|nr:thioredoxin fold domain-containing protein [Acidithiobacillus sp.]MCK9188742.1 thioredoxin fold domain-containing protein [Acidithiobacillus sp.]MCK9359716.1 thioredoxin fold domain-containing protein [Acidithiobacillus sp.]
METENQSRVTKGRIGFRKAAGLRFAALLFGPLALAGCASSQNLKSAEHLVQNNFHGQAHVIKVFPGPTKKLTGIVAENAQHQQGILWMLSNRYLLLGPVVNDKGHDITRTATKKYLVQPRKVPAEQIALAAMKAPGFTIGHAGPLIVVFMDPNCIYCHLLWKALQEPVAEGQLRAKLIPVGFLKDSSVAKAATILAAKDPAVAWANNEKGFDENTEEGGTRPLAQIPPKDIAAINTNTALLQSSGEEATPTLLFCQKNAPDANASAGKTDRQMTLEHGIAMHALPTLIKSLDGNVSADGCIP